MCGITGFLNDSDIWREGHAPRVLAGMVSAIAHRGPDSDGVWIDRANRIALGHTRLAIVDLSVAGHQPMTSADERFVISFNGEIYNHLDLRAELEALGHRFRSTSDTETLVQAIAQWGVVSACKRLVGMFAFAAWDRLERKLWLARDPIGKKPLYVYEDPDGGYAFASELKALWHYPTFHPEIQADALAHYFRYSYVPDHVSIYRGVTKVMPGTVLEIGIAVSPVSHRYWDLKAVVQRQTRDRITDTNEAQQMLLALLKDATERRMLSDVPLGAFLSGGVDSCLVVSLMQQASSSRIKTFSIGFRESGFDEAPVAKAVARHLGTDHTEFYVDQPTAQDTVPGLPAIFDEPFADASQIPTVLLARLTRQQVTVALTGDGGDESFGGYLRYRNHAGLVGALSGAPRPMRQAVSHALLCMPSEFWDGVARVVPRSRRPRFMASKVAKVARAIRENDFSERSKSFLSFWPPGDILAPGLGRDAGDPFAVPACLDTEPAEAMQYWETRHYLPGDLLTKVDRATMASALEARSPLLDHRVVELAWRIPSEMKANKSVTKRILRDLLSHYVPPDIVGLPKQGFSVPVGAWMQQGLRDWAESVLSYGRSNLQDVLDWRQIDRSWRAHIEGRTGEVEKMWIVLMFCAWHEHWLVTGSARMRAA